MGIVAALLVVHLITAKNVANVKCSLHDIGLCDRLFSIKVRHSVCVFVCFFFRFFGSLLKTLTSPYDPNPNKLNGLRTDCVNMIIHLPNFNRNRLGKLYVEIFIKVTLLMAFSPYTTDGGAEGRTERSPSWAIEHHRLSLWPGKNFVTLSSHEPMGQNCYNVLCRLCLQISFGIRQDTFVQNSVRKRLVLCFNEADDFLMDTPG